MSEPHENIDMEQYLRALAEQIIPGLPKGVGFCFWIYDFGDSGFLSYIGNGQRADVRRMVQEWLDKTAKE